MAAENLVAGMRGEPLPTAVPVRIRPRRPPQRRRASAPPILAAVEWRARDLQSLAWLNPTGRQAGLGTHQCRRCRAASVRSSPPRPTMRTPSAAWTTRPAPRSPTSSDGPADRWTSSSRWSRASGLEKHGADRRLAQDRARDGPRRRQPRGPDRPSADRSSTSRPTRCSTRCTPARRRRCARSTSRSSRSPGGSATTSSSPRSRPTCALRRSKQFGTVGPASGGRLEVGLNLKGVAPAGRLEATTGMCTHRVRLSSPAEFDDEDPGLAARGVRAGLIRRRPRAPRRPRPVGGDAGVARGRAADATRRRTVSAGGRRGHRPARRRRPPGRSGSRRRRRCSSAGRRRS